MVANSLIETMSNPMAVINGHHRQVAFLWFCFFSESEKIEFNLSEWL